LFITGPAPAGGGSKAGQVRCVQIPEKSGADAALVFPAGRSADAAEKAIIAAAADAAANKKVFRSAVMLQLLLVRMEWRNHK
jgi:hypothetical protein